MLFRSGGGATRKPRFDRSQGGLGPDRVARVAGVAVVGGQVEVGPAIAAGAIALGGIGVALWCNAASFVAVVVAVSMVSLRQAPGEKRPVFGALADG